MVVLRRCGSQLLAHCHIPCCSSPDPDRLGVRSENSWCPQLCRVSLRCLLIASQVPSNFPVGIKEKVHRGFFPSHGSDGYFDIFPTMEHGPGSQGVAEVEPKVPSLTPGHPIKEQNAQLRGATHILTVTESHSTLTAPHREHTLTHSQRTLQST